MKILIAKFLPVGTFPSYDANEPHTTLMIPGENRQILVKIVDAVAVFEIEPETK